MSEMEWRSRAIREPLFKRTKLVAHWAPGLKPGNGEPAVRVFVMGANTWRTAESWPVPDTRFTEYYLHSRGAANSRHGNGLLSTERPTGILRASFRAWAASSSAVMSSRLSCRCRGLRSMRTRCHPPLISRLQDGIRGALWHTLDAGHRAGSTSRDPRQSAHLHRYSLLGMVPSNVP
jgi:hypothetical protein